MSPLCNITPSTKVRRSANSNHASIRRSKTAGSCIGLSRHDRVVSSPRTERVPHRTRDHVAAQRGCACSAPVYPGPTAVRGGTHPTSISERCTAPKFVDPWLSISGSSNRRVGLERLTRLEGEQRMPKVMTSANESGFDYLFRWHANGDVET